MSAKKRQRLVLVCDNCHKRKIKCDRTLPCNSCTQRGIAALCCYSNLDKELAKQGKTAHSVKLSENNVNQELEVLKTRLAELETVKSRANSASGVLIPDKRTLEEALALSDLTGVNPVAAAEETSDFFYNVPPGDLCTNLQESFGLACPLSFISIVKRDKGYKYFWQFNRSKNQAEAFKHHIASGLSGVWDRNFGETPNVEETGKLYFGETAIPKVEPRSDEFSIRKILSIWGSQHGLTFYRNYIPASCSVLTKLSFVLPSKSIINRYLEVYFDRVHRIFPIYDKQSFLESIDKLIEERSDDASRVSINIEKKTDIAVLISLLFTLRLAYVYLIHYASNSRASDYKMADSLRQLLDHPIHYDVVDVAKNCLKEFNQQMGSSMKVLQANLQFRISKLMSFEDGDATRDTDFQGASLIEAACVQGLNRDPDYFVNDNLDEATKNHRRKLWFVLVAIGTIEAALFGRGISEEIPDNVKLPTDYSDDKFDECASFVYNIKALLACRRHMARLTRCMLSITTPIPLDELTDHLSLLENNLRDAFGDFRELINYHPSSVEESDHKTFQIFILLALKSFTLRVYFVLYLIYDKQGKSAASFFYFKKLFHTLLVDPGAVFEPLSRSSFGSDPLFCLLNIPIMVRFSFVQITGCVINTVRVGFVLKTLASGDPRWEALTRLRTHLLQVPTKCVRFLGPFVGRYYSAWKSSRACIYSLFVCRGNDLYQYEPAKPDATWHFTREQINEIDAILVSLLRNLGPYVVPVPKTNPQLLWLDLVPYDQSKSEEDNYMRQRIHMSQIDNSWNQFVSLLPDGEGIPSQFKTENDNVANTQIPNLLNVDIINGSMDILQTFGGFPPQEDFFLNDSLYGHLS